MMNIIPKNINIINQKNEVKNAPPKNTKKRKNSKKFTNSQSNINSKNNFIQSSNINNLNDIYKEKKLDNIIINMNNEKSDILPINDYEYNNMAYDDALIYDKRTYFEYYWSLLKTKHILLFAFIQTNDYNSTINKISLFAFSFALYLTINALFFTDSTIHKIYQEEGEYNFIYQLPQILYSTIISSVINIIIKFLSLSEKNILKLKNEKNIDDIVSQKQKLLKILRIKFIWFFNISLIFLLFFWYYLGCFCAIYKNTQIHLLKDFLVSFSLSLFYPFGINLIPGIFRISSLKNNKKCNYQISKIIQLI